VEVKAHEDALDAVICAWVGVCALEDLARRRLEMRTRRSGFQVRKDNDLLSAVARVHHCRRSELSIPSGTSGRCTLSFSPIVNSWIRGMARPTRTRLQPARATMMQPIVIRLSARSGVDGKMLVRVMRPRG
jgi:hypothetical protein